jgi:hypothetical protein
LQDKRRASKAARAALLPQAPKPPHSRMVQVCHMLLNYLALPFPNCLELHIASFLVPKKFTIHLCGVMHPPVDLVGALDTKMSKVLQYAKQAHQIKPSDADGNVFRLKNQRTGEEVSPLTDVGSMMMGMLPYTERIDVELFFRR